MDEKQQVSQFTWNGDDTLNSITYASRGVATPGISYTYDTNYARLISLTDGAGTHLYSYYPIAGSATLGAGQLASEEGPLPNDIITYGYDELGRPIQCAINGVLSTTTYDPAGRVTQTQQTSRGAVPRTTSATYTVSGKPATATDANGNVTRFAYDILDRRTAVTDPMARTTIFTYDALSRPEMPKTVLVAAMHSLIAAEKARK